jgi:hypothetical protein
VVPIRPDAPAPAKGHIDAACGTDGEPTDTVREGASVFRFRDEMDVVVLNGELEDAKRPVRGGGQGPEHRGKGAHRPQATERFDGTERDVNGMSGDVFCATPVRDPGSSARCPPSPGARPPATPRARLGQ